MHVWICTNNAGSNRKRIMEDSRGCWCLFYRIFFFFFLDLWRFRRSRSPRSVRGSGISSRERCRWTAMVSRTRTPASGWARATRPASCAPRTRATSPWARTTSRWASAAICPPSTTTTWPARTGSPAGCDQCSPRSRAPPNPWGPHAGTCWRRPPRAAPSRKPSDPVGGDAPRTCRS